MGACVCKNSAYLLAITKAPSVPHAEEEDKMANIIIIIIIRALQWPAHVLQP